MNKKPIITITLMMLLNLLFVGCVENGNEDSGDDGDDLVKTFSCNTGADADMHLVNGVCGIPVTRYHAYDLGRELVLQRIEGNAMIEYGGSGSGSIMFYMSSQQEPIFGDMDWIRVYATFNAEVTFDEIVYPTNKVYKTRGRYLIISCGTSLTLSMGLSEGTAYFSEVDGI